jgi:hypothetical protein
MARDPERWPAYSASIRLVLDNGVAHVVKESARIRETLGGEVRGDGGLALDGTGEWKDGSGTRWRYHFDGRFDGSRFEAQGVMLGPATSTRLRDCSMALRRVHASRAVPQTAQAAAAKAKVAQAVEPAVAIVQPPATTPSPSPESMHAPAAAEKGAPVVLAAAEQSRESAREVSGTNDAAPTQSGATKRVSERVAAAESESRFKTEWLVLFLVLAGIAVLMDKYFLK